MDPSVKLRHDHRNVSPASTCRSGRIKPLPKERWDRLFDSAGWVQRNMFPPPLTYTSGSRVFGVTCERALYNKHIRLDGLQNFLASLDRAAARLERIGWHPEGRTFPIQFNRDQGNFAVGPGGYLVFIGLEYLSKMQDAPGKRLREAVIDIESQYFHELIHCARIDLFDDGSEALPLLGQFLYSPSDHERWASKYKEATESAISYSKGEGPSLTTLCPYDSGWHLAMAKVLGMIPRLQAHATSEELLLALFSMPRSERDALLGDLIARPL